MADKDLEVSIITLTKNDKDNLINTINSITSQSLKLPFEILIIDGSKELIQEQNIYLIKKNILKSVNIHFNHYNMVRLGINGIYPCMNFALNKVKGKSIIFMNSGDRFYNEDSLEILYNSFHKQASKNCFSFGQALIYFNENNYWLFPSSLVRNIRNWINFFEPNHQSMLISRELACSIAFNEDVKVIADGLWKREVIKSSKSWVFVNTPVCKFGLEGVSNTKPNKYTFQKQIKSNKISFIRKIIITIKYITPQKIFKFYPFFQKLKNTLLSIFF